jgi:hypothetical protein
VREAKENVPDIDLLRELAVSLKKQDFNLNSFASAYRQRAMLQTRGLNDDQIDDMIEQIDEDCFREGIEVKTFIHLIGGASYFSEKYSCTIGELDKLKTEKENEIMQLDDILQGKKEELQIIKGRIETALAKENLTEQDISDYKQNEPLLEKISILKDELKEANIKIKEANFEYEDLRAFAIWRDLSGASLVNPVTLEIIDTKVVRACFLLARNPLQFRHEINYINKQEPKLPVKAGYIPDIEVRFLDIATY